MTVIFCGCLSSTCPSFIMLTLSFASSHLIKNCCDGFKRYKEGADIKTYGKRVANSVPFRMPDKSTAVPIHVCVSECQGGSQGEVSLIDLFIRSVVLQVKSTITELAARKFGPLIGGASGHPTRRSSLSKGSPPQRRWTVNGRQPSRSRSPPRREPSVSLAPTRMPSEPTRRPSGELRIQSPREIAAGHHHDVR